MDADLEKQFRRETGKSPLAPGVEIYNIDYIAWLEKKLKENQK